MQEVGSPRKRRFLFGSIAAGVLVLAAGSALVVAHAGGRGPHAMHGGGMDFDEISDHFQVHIEHVLEDVDASPDQQAQVRAIVASAAEDVKALRAQHAGAHTRLQEILVAPSVDRGQLETLRAEHVAAIDAASKRCVTALADAADVLTPEQRSKLAARLERRMDKGMH